MPALRILSYNVRYFGHATRGLASTRAPMLGIARALAALDSVPDIVCLQEVETVSLRSTLLRPQTGGRETQLEQLMAALGEALARAGKPDAYEAYYFPAHDYSLGAGASLYTTGLAILAHRDFQVSAHNAREPADITCRRVHAVRRFKQTRVCAHVRFRHRSGHSIDVFNTHLSLPSAFAPEFWGRPARMGFGKNQLEEARKLVGFIHAERESDRFLVTGDFNSLPGSPVYRFLVEEGGLSDPFAELSRSTDEELRAWPTAGFLRLRMHVDHVLSGSGLEWMDFDGSRPFGDPEAGFHGLSDHVPLVARCRVRRGGGCARAVLGTRRAEPFEELPRVASVSGASRGPKS